MANTIPPELQTALNDFDATITAKPNLTDAELLQKFPEFKNDAKLLQAAHDYSATKKSGKYKDVETLNSKFPEFDESNYKSNDLKKKGNTESPSLDGTLPSPKGKMSFAEWKDSPEYSENSSYDDYLKGKTTQKVDYVSQLKKLGIPQDKIDAVSNMSEEQIRNLPGIPKEQADKIISVHSQIKQQNDKQKIAAVSTLPTLDVKATSEKKQFPGTKDDKGNIIEKGITDVEKSKNDVDQTNLKLAQSYAKKGEYDKAISLSQSVAADNPKVKEYADYSNRLGGFSSSMKGDFKTAAEFYDAIGTKTPDDHYNAAYNKFQSGDIGGALKNIKEIEALPTEENNIDSKINAKKIWLQIAKESGDKITEDKISTDIDGLNQRKDEIVNGNVFNSFEIKPLTPEEWKKGRDALQNNFILAPILGAAENVGEAITGAQKISEGDVNGGMAKMVKGVSGALFNANPEILLFNYVLGAASKAADSATVVSNPIQYNLQKIQEQLGDNATQNLQKHKNIVDHVSEHLFAPLTSVLNDFGLLDKIPEAERDWIGSLDVVASMAMMHGAGEVKDYVLGKKNVTPEQVQKRVDDVSKDIQEQTSAITKLKDGEQPEQKDVDNAIKLVENSVKKVEPKPEEKPVQAYDYDKTLQNEDGSLTDLGKEVSTREDKSDIHIITGNPDKAMIAEKLGINENQIDVVEGSEEEKANAKAEILSDLDEKQGVAHFVDDNKMNRQKAEESGIDKVQTPEENLEGENKLHPDWEKEYEEKPKEETKPIEGEDTDTSLKRAVADNEKSKREGTEAVGNMVNALQSTDVKEAYNNAKTKVDNKEIDPDEVTERVNKNNTGSLEDEAILLYDRARLRNEEIKLIKDRDNSKTKAERDSISDKLQNIWEKQADNDLAAAKLGREASNLFRLRKAYVDSEFSIYSMEREFKSAHNLTELTPEQKEHIKNQREEMIKADAKINELREQLKTEKAARKFAENALNEAKKQAKEQAKSERKLSNKAKIDKSKVRVEQIKDRIKGIVREQMKTAGAIPVNPELAAEIAKLAKEKVYQGAVKLDDVVKDILDELKDVLPDWTKKDVLDHLAYKNERKPISEETKIGQKVKKSAQLQKQIEEGADNFVKPEKRSYLPSQNLQDAMAEYERLKWQWKNELHRAEMKNRHWSEKTVDKIIKARTGIMLLSGVKTLAKLFHYTAMETLVGEPVDMLMTGLSQLLGPVAKKSLVEGHFDLSAEGEFYKTFGKKQTYKEIKEYAKSHQAQIDLLYGKITQIIPEEFRVSGGFLHGLEKYPLRKATFTRDYIKLAKSYEKMGFDPTDPATEKIIGGMAMNKANYRIMMSQNKISTLLNAVQSRLRSPDMGKLGKIGFYASKILFPIMRVPTNFTIKTLRSWGGLAEFGLRMTQGVSKMTPEEADNAILAFKNGVPGAAIGLAVLGSNVITTDDQGRLEIGGWKVPNFLTHHPMIMTAKLFADAKKEWNKKGGTWYDAALKPAFETAKETPYFGDQMLSAISDQNKFKQFIQNTAITFMEPQLMKDIASIPDHEQKTLFNMIFTDPTYRKPQDFIDKLKLGIPGLRETVVQPKEQEIIKKAVEERVEELKTPKQQDLEERQKRVDEIIKKNNKSHTYINKKGEKIDLDNATDKELDYIEDETQTQAEKDEKEVKKKYAKEIEEKAQKQINQ